MTPEMQKLITLLRKEIGYQEQSGGYTKFGDWYNAVETDSDYSDQPWCDMFLSWGANHLGYSDWFGDVLLHGRARCSGFRRRGPGAANRNRGRSSSSTGAAEGASMASTT